MKKWIILLLCCLLLTGCDATGAMETLGNVEHVSATQPVMRKIRLALPQDATVLTMSGEDTIYLCQDYAIAVQVLPGGDLSGTIRSITGFEKDVLTVMETACGDHKQYAFAWTAAAEAGDAVCRGVVLDDGNYHYALSLSADAAAAPALKQVWSDLLESFCLEG